LKGDHKWLRKVKYRFWLGKPLQYYLGFYKFYYLNPVASYLIKEPFFSEYGELLYYELGKFRVNRITESVFAPNYLSTLKFILKCFFVEYFRLSIS
jgi:hypothetical protein